MKFIDCPQCNENLAVPSLIQDGLVCLECGFDMGTILIKRFGNKIFNLGVKSDGGKNNFYLFADYVKDVDSLARFLRLNGAEFNILKSLTSNIGKRHSGTDQAREVKKCLHYSVERMLWYGLDKEEILSQVKKQLEES